MRHHGHSVIWKTMKTAHGAVHGGRHFSDQAQEAAQALGELPPPGDPMIAPAAT